MMIERRGLCIDDRLGIYPKSMFYTFEQSTLVDYGRESGVNGRVLG